MPGRLVPGGAEDAGREGRGHLSFPMRGYTLALDFPRRDGVEELVARLESPSSLDHGGRVYLAKDAVLMPEASPACIRNWANSATCSTHRSGAPLFTSDMARRLNIRDTAETRHERGATWLVLGASSSIARAFALEAAADGANVLLAGRDRDDLDRSAADIGIRTTSPCSVIEFDAWRRSTRHEACCSAPTRRVGGSGRSTSSSPSDDAGAGRRSTAIRTRLTGPSRRTIPARSPCCTRLAPMLEAQRRGPCRRARLGRRRSRADQELRLRLGQGRAHRLSAGAARAAVPRRRHGDDGEAGLRRHGDDFGPAGHVPGGVARRGARAPASPPPSAGGKRSTCPSFWWIIMTIIRNIPERIFKRLSI